MMIYILYILYIICDILYILYILYVICDISYIIYHISYVINYTLYFVYIINHCIFIHTVSNHTWVSSAMLRFRFILRHVCIHLYTCQSLSFSLYMCIYRHRFVIFLIFISLPTYFHTHIQRHTHTHTRTHER